MDTTVLTVVIPFYVKVTVRLEIINNVKNVRSRPRGSSQVQIENGCLII